MLIFQFILIQTIIFGIVIFILRRIMLKSTESSVNRLNKSYEELNERKEKLAELIKKAEEEYEKKKQEAKMIVKEMREKTQEELDDKRSKLMEKAHKDAERLLSDTMSAKDRIRDEIRREEKMRMVEIVEELLGQALGEMFNKKIDRLLIDDFASEFSEMDTSNIPPSVKEVEFITRSGMEEDQKKKVLELIEKKAGRKLALKEQTDPKVIGGIVIKFGSLTLDGSVASKLEDSAVKRKIKIEQEA